MGAGMTTETPFPSSVELMLRIQAPLIDARQANSLAIEACRATIKIRIRDNQDQKVFSGR
jgi:hypothetical protein